MTDEIEFHLPKSSFINFFKLNNRVVNSPIKPKTIHVTFKFEEEEFYILNAFVPFFSSNDFNMFTHLGNNYYMYIFHNKRLFRIFKDLIALFLDFSIKLFDENSVKTYGVMQYEFFSMEDMISFINLHKVFVFTDDFISLLFNNGYTFIDYLVYDQKFINAFKDDEFAILFLEKYVFNIELYKNYDIHNIYNVNSSFQDIIDINRASEYKNIYLFIISLRYFLFINSTETIEVDSGNTQKFGFSSFYIFSLINDYVIQRADDIHNDILFNESLPIIKNTLKYVDSKYTSYLYNYLGIADITEYLRARIKVVDIFSSYVENAPDYISNIPIFIFTTDAIFNTHKYVNYNDFIEDDLIHYLSTLGSYTPISLQRYGFIQVESNDEYFDHDFLSLFYDERISKHYNIDDELPITKNSDQNIIHLYDFESYREFFKLKSPCKITFMSNISIKFKIMNEKHECTYRIDASDKDKVIMTNEYIIIKDISSIIFKSIVPKLKVIM